MGLLSLFLSLLLRGFSYPSLYWHFNNVSTPGPGLTLFSGTSNPPTITSAGTLIMDSNAAFGRVDPSIVITGDSTFVMRFYPTNNPTWSRLIDFGNGPGSDNIVIAFDGGGTIIWHIYNGGTTYPFVCNGDWNANAWNIVILTIGQGSAAHYSNGTVKCQWNTGVIIPNIIRQNQFIGKSNWVDPYWTGELDFIWYLPRAVGGTEAMLLNVDAEIMGNYWTFQSPNNLDYREGLLNSPSLSGGTLNLHGDTTQAATINPAMYSLSGPTTFAARVRLDSYPSWSRVVDFSSSSTNDAVIFSIQSTTTTVNWAVWQGGSQQSMLCNNFWQTPGQWMDVVATVQGTNGVVYRNGVQWCTSANMWEPRAVPRDWQYIGKSRENHDGGWDGAFEYVMHWNRSLSATEATYLWAGRGTLNPWIVTHFPSSWDYPFSGTASLSNGKASFTGGGNVQVDSTVIQLSTPFTVSMYVQMNSWQYNCRLMDFSNGATTDNVALAMDGSTSNLRFVLGTTTVMNCGNYFTLNDWTQITLTHDGTTARLYKNGNQICSQNVNPVALKTRTLQYVGKSTDNSNNVFDGSIDYFMLFNRSLSAPEVSALPDAWDRYFTTCAALVPTDPRVDPGNCVNFAKQGTFCNLLCKSPYVPFNAAQGQCLTPLKAERASWQGQTLTCVAQCPVSIAPANGSQSCSGPWGNNYENTLCSFSCSVGFTLTGSPTSTCSPSSTWTTPAPTCVAVDCQPVAVQYGNATCNGVFGPLKYTATCSYSCPAGFLLVGATSSVCLSNGTWSTATPSCIPKPCSSLTLPNGNVSCVNPYGGPWTYGSTCVYTCSGNYYMTVGNASVQSATTSCDSTLTWRNSPTNSPNPVCSLVTCSNLTNPDRGTVSCDKGTFNLAFGVTSKCSYSCNSGFQLSSNQSLVCLNTGSWSLVTPPTCVDIDECSLQGTCLSGAKCGNLVGGYYCGPTFTTNVTSILSNSSTLALTTGERVTFSLSVGTNVNLLFTSLSYLLNPTSAVTYCTGVSMVNKSTTWNVACNVSAGLGSNLKLTLSYQVVGNLSLGSVDSPTFNYPPPTIQSGSLRLFGGQPSTHVVSVNYTKGDTISFDGTGFLPSSTLLSVTYGPQFSLLQSPCALILSSCNTTTITCKTQPFASGSNLVFTVNANGVTAVGVDTFSIDNVPSVVSVSAAPTTGCIVSDTYLYGCPTTGQVSISITANYLADIGLAGFIGGLACDFQAPLINVSQPNGISNFIFNCMLPAGTGFNRSIVLTADGKYSQARNLLSYASPVITNITGCINNGQFAVVQCARAGGDSLVVLGTNFGADGSSVSIGGVRCTRTVPDTLAPHNRVVCITPSGYGVGRQVQLFQSAGPFSSEAAALDYTQCPSGSYQDGTKTTCTLCNAGYYSSAIGQFSCSACDPGRYAPGNGSGTCLPCPPGSSQSTTGMSRCDQCNPGFYAVANGAVSCLACDPGTNATYRGSITCSPCPPGRVSQKNGTTGPTTCSACDAGYFSGSSQQGVCQICPVGTYSYPAGASTCTECDPGYYQGLQGQTECSPCSPGAYTAVPGRSECAPCDSGTATNDSHATFCGTCQPGTVSKREVGSLVGPVGCMECELGTFMSTTGQAVCIGCTPGTYANTTGMTACLQCDPGNYQSNSSAPDCAPCPVGSYSALPGRPECSLCGSGSRSNITAASTCVQCDPGTFSTLPSGVGVTDCTPCLPGTYVNTRGQVACLQCAVGTFSSGVGAIQCSSCPPGTSAPSGGSKDCTVCPPGQYSAVQSQGSCSPCPVGKFAADYNSSVCQDCSAGMYQSSSGASFCQHCDPGYYAAVAGRDVCSPCSLGKYSPRNQSSNCTDCSPGTFQLSQAQSSCDPCPLGYANAATGQSLCLPCPGGQITNVSGGKRCMDCPVGKSQAESGSTSCINCIPGKYAPIGSAACLTCPVGLVSNEQGMSTCINCQANSGADKTQSGCDCVAGYFLDENITLVRNVSVMASTGVCESCPVGTVCIDKALTRSTLPTQNGYYLTDSDSLTYQKCLSPKSCVGGQCINHRTGLLCSRCLPGYSMSEWTKECTVCGTTRSSRANMGLTIVGLLIAVMVLYAYIISTALQSAANLQFQTQSGSTKAAHAAASTLESFMSQGTNAAGHHGGGAQSQPSPSNSARIQSPINDSSGRLHVTNPNDSSRQNVSSAPPSPGGPSSPSSALSSAGIQQGGSGGNEINASLRQNPDQSSESINRKVAAKSDRKQVSDNTYVLKILVNFFQVASSLVALPVSGAIAFPTYYMAFLSYFKFLNIDFIPWQNVGCLFPLNFYNRLVVLTLVPLVMIIFLGIVVAITTIILDLRDMADSNQGRTRRQKIRFVFLRGVIFTAFMLYPTISSSVLSHFVCLKVGKQKLLVADFSIVCYSAIWRKWTPFVVAMTVIYPIGIPSLFFVLLYKNRESLTSPFATLGLGFLHESYIPQVWWFEVLVMVQKLTLTSLLQFLPLSLQLGGGVAVAAAFLITLVLVQPEIRLRNWLLHMLANVEIVMLLLLWHFSYRDNITQAPIGIDASISALFIVLTVILATLLFLDVLRWVKEKVFFLVRHVRTSRS